MQIFSNGFMAYTTTFTEDIDEDGIPIPAAATEAECRCTITTATENRNATYDGGTVKRASYTVTCNMEDVQNPFAPTQVHLRHDKKGDLGMFSVQRIEYYDITQTIELWV